MLTRMRVTGIATLRFVMACERLLLRIFHIVWGLLRFYFTQCPVYELLQGILMCVCVYIYIHPGVDGRIILRWIFMKWDMGAWIGSIWLRIGTGDGYV